jgi:hypothetical protein
MALEEAQRLEQEKRELNPLSSSRTERADGTPKAVNEGLAEPENEVGA